MMRLLKISQNTAYRVRRELLKQYHEQKDARAAQWGLPTKAEEPCSSQQEEKPQETAN